LQKKVVFESFKQNEGQIKPSGFFLKMFLNAAGGICGENKVKKFPKSPQDACSQ